MQNSKCDGKKLLFVSANIYPLSTGGTQISLFEICKRINKKYNVTLYLTHLEKDIRNVPELSEFKVLPSKRKRNKKIFSLKILDFLNKINKTWRTLKEFKPDVIFVFFIDAFSYICLLYARSKKIPIFVRSEGSDLNVKKNFIFQFMKKKVCKFADQIICTSRPHIDIVNKFNPKNPPVLIGNGSRFERQKLDLDLEKGKNSFKLIFVGALIKVKNVSTLIKAIKILIDNEKNCKGKISVDIIGDGSLKKDLMNLVEKYQLNEKIHFLGNLNKNQLLEEYQNADIFILPSISESAPLVLIEAITFGIPLICSEIPNLTYFYKPDVNALYFPHDKPEELSKKIIELINDEDLRIRLRKNNWEFADSFSWDNIVEKIDKIISHYI